MTEKLILRHTAENSASRIVRIWEKVGQNTVRLIDHELMYNFSSKQWELCKDFTQTYEITNDGLLVGDGSNWSGDSMPWKEYAKERHNKLLSCRFPYECGEKEQTPTVEQTAKQLIEQNY